MSEDERPDDQQDATPEDQAPEPGDAVPPDGSDDAPIEGDSPEPTGGGESDPSAGPDGDASAPEEEVSDEAASALKAAQEAVAQVMGGDGLSDATGADEAAVDSAQGAAVEMDRLASEAAGGRAIGAGLPVDGAPSPVDLPSFDRVGPAATTAEMRLLGDVIVDVRIELGRTRMLVEDVLRLNEGAVVELEKLAGDPVDVFVNGRHVAKGEVLVLNENFCIRVNEVLEPGPVKNHG